MRWSAVLVGSVLVVASCGGDDNVSNNAGSNNAGGAGGFAIEALPLDMTGDVWAWPSDVTAWPASQFPPIHVFGKDYEGKVESTMTFDMVKPGAQVLSPIAGRVIDVREQPETCDVELYIGSDAAQQTVSLDHVVATVAKGDTVTAGQVVATVPAWRCKESWGRFELMMVREVDGVVQSFCPADFWSDAVAAKARSQIAGVMQQWNAHAAGSKSVYTAEELAKGICSTPTAPAN